jgi:hypothetical protein
MVLHRPSSFAASSAGNGTARPREAGDGPLPAASGVSHSMAGMPSGGPAEAVVGDTLAIAADVVGAAGQRQRCEERAGGILDVQRGTKVADGLVVAGARAVQEPKPQHHAAPAGLGEALGLLLGGEREAQDRRDVGDGCGLGHGPLPGMDEGHGGLDVDRRACRDCRVDEDL